MKMAKKDADCLRPEYNREDLGQGIRGKYYQGYQESNQLVLLSPEVAAVFSTEEAVNEALRYLIKIAKLSTSSVITNSEAI